jgi:hypothetical protein
LCQLLGHDHDVNMFTLSGSIDYKQTKKIQSSRSVLALLEVVSFHEDLSKAKIYLFCTNRSTYFEPF